MRGRFVAVLGQGRTGSTLITRLLNTSAGAHIAGENLAAFQHLRHFASGIRHGRTDNDGSHHALAWTAAPGIAKLDCALRALIEKLYNPDGRYMVYGFKEIRFGQGSYLELAEDLGFLRRVVPNARFILNVRDTDTCVRSSWWADNPEQSRRTLATIRENFSRYHVEHPDHTFWMRYEEITAGSVRLQQLFDFVGIAPGATMDQELASIVR